MMKYRKYETEWRRKGHQKGVLPFFYASILLSYYPRPMLLSPQELHKLKLSIQPGDRVYFYGDLGAGKTTLIQYIINSLLGIEKAVRSPTYVYYNKYANHIYHMDLYRLGEYDEFVSIGGEEIFENPANICLVEWPQIVAEHYKPTVIIRIEKPDDREDVRDFSIEYTRN